MLERASTCLDTGARLSLRCARRAPRSKRSLHSAFWTHGAGDLAPYLLPNQYSPEAPKEPDFRSQHAHAWSPGQDSAYGSGGVGQTPFLDFLYPPQALALLQNNSGESWEAWERRNSRRLPKGFVHARRGYSSKSRTSDVSKVMEKLKRTAQEDQDDVVSGSKRQTKGSYTPMRVKQLGKNKGETTEDEYGAYSPEQNDDQDLPPVATESPHFFVNTASELAESSHPNLAQLRTAMDISRGNIALANTKKSLAFTNSVWGLFEKLEARDRNDPAVKTDLLQWLSRNHNDVAETHCLELYDSIPLNARTLGVYKAALSVFLRCNLYGLAEQGHREALERLSNGPEFSAWLCKFAIEHQMWDMAFRIKQQLDGLHEEFVRSVNETMFWRQLSDMPDLLASAIGLSKHYRMLKRSNSLSPDFTLFCTRIFKAAIETDWRTEDLNPLETSKNPLKSGKIRYLLQKIQMIDPYPPDVFRNILVSIVGPSSKIYYPEAHWIVSYMFRQYTRMPGVIADEDLLLSLIKRLTHHYEQLDKIRRTPNSISIDTVTEYWRLRHGGMSNVAYTEVMKFYALRGAVDKVEAYFSTLLQDHSDWSHRRNAASMLVYVHARRADTASAKTAFERVREIANQSGHSLTLTFWNILMHAFARAGDTEGALTTLDGVVKESSLRPDEYTFHPLLEMYAARGDLEAVESLLQQYDELSGAPRNTRLYGSLLNAHIARGDVREAQTLLQDLVPRVKHDNAVMGSLTGCYNILLTALAIRREVDQTMQMYRWMKEEKIKTDADTFGALILALTLHGSVLHARQILNKVMPQNGHRPTALHYALIFGGYVRNHMWDAALEFHGLMKRKNVLPSLGTNVTYLRAKALMEKRGQVSGGSSAADELREMLNSDPNARLAPKQPQTVDWKDYGSPAAAHFGHFVLIHGNKPALRAAQELIREYKDNIQAGSMLPPQAPVNVLQALIEVYCLDKDWASVDECWMLIKEWTDALAPLGPLPLVGLVDADDADNAESEISALLLPPPASAEQPNVKQILRRKSGYAVSDVGHQNQDSKTPSSRSSIAPAVRSMLSNAVRSYTTALSLQARNADMINTVTRVLSQGYTLDNLSWNVFIEHLLRPSPPLALLAFRLVERYLIPHFPGWKYATKYPPTANVRIAGTQYMRTGLLSREQLMPKYRTMVKLGAALLDLRRIEAVGFGRERIGESRNGGIIARGSRLEKYVGSTRAIRRLAPKTLHSVQSMPSVRDRLQELHLRRAR